MNPLKHRSGGLLAGVLAVLVGGVVLIGWALDIAALKSVLPGWVSMKPNTAVGFVLTGLALLLHRPPSALNTSTFSFLPRLSRLSRLFALFAGLIGLLSLGEYAFGWNPGFDQWLFPEPAGTSNPGRMAPDTALCFVLFAASLQFASRPRRTQIATLLLGSAMITVALVEILSYFTPGLRITGWGGLTMMALPTATVFAAVGAVLVQHSWRIVVGPRLTRFSRNALMSVGLLLLLTTVFVLYILAERQIESTNELRYRSYQLADELRQSGDDLTRMIRTYVATGNPVYKEYFQDILDIRDGRKPRPDNYSRPYWDLVLETGPAPRGSHTSVPLLELMRQAGFTGQELGKLAEAKAKSDALTILEFEAMKLVETAGPEAERNWAGAVRMLYDDKYHQAKVTVMRPIDDFFALLDQRTLVAVQAAEMSSLVYRILFGAIALGLILMFWRTYAALGDTLGGGLDEVHAAIASIGSGDFSSAIIAKSSTKDSVMGWLAETQARLDDADRKNKQADAAIQGAEALSDTIINSIPGIFYLLDEHGCYVRWNPYQRDVILGKPEEQMAGLNALDTIHPEDRAFIQERIANVLQDGKEEVVEGRVLLRGGPAFIWMMMSGRRLTIAGRPFLVGTGIDVSARKQAEKTLHQSRQAALNLMTDAVAERNRSSQLSLTLQESEVKFRQTFDLSPVGIVMVGLDKRLHRANNSFSRFLGYPPEELVGKTIEDVTFAEDRTIGMAEMMAIVKGEIDTSRVQKRYVRKDGESVWGEATISLIRDQEHRPQYFLAIIEDITERKRNEAELHRLFELSEHSRLDLLSILEDQRRTEESLRESRRLLSRAEELGRVGGWELDIETKQQTWTETVYDIHEMDTRGHPTIDQGVNFYTPESRPIIEQAVERAIVQGEPFDVELEIVTAKGNVRCVHAVGEADLVHNKVSGFFQDITERKHAQEKIRKLNAELEQRVIDRTAQLEVANKELEAFSYSVSHDLRAPLRSIDGFSQALLEDYHDKLDEDGKNHLTRVRSAAQRMAQLIDDVLDLSRIHRAEMSRVSIDLSGLAKELVEDLRETQPRENVEVAIEPEMSALGDTQLLRLFLQNLLENAWKFTSKHEHAKIEIGSRETDGKKVFYVKDDGAGFDMAHSAMLFAPFQRLHAQGDFPGTGVGLASAQRIIHRHGGKIWAESEVEKGATFYFTL